MRRHLRHDQTLPSSRRFGTRRRVIGGGALALLAVAGSFLIVSQAAASHRQGSPVTLEVWDWGQTNSKARNALNAMFMKSHPDIKIKRVIQPFTSYPALVRAAIASHSGPDIIENYGGGGTFDYYNGIIPLTNYRTPEQKRDIYGWQNVSAGLDASKPPYAVPFAAAGQLLYYNKALFRKAGLKPVLPKTWPEFLADCAALKKAGIIPLVTGFKDGYQAETWMDVLGSQYMTDAQLKAFPRHPQWTSAPIYKGFNLLVQLNQLGYTTPHSEGIAIFPDAVNNFAAGKGALFMGFTSDLAYYGDFTGLGKNLGVGLPPLVPGGRWKTQRFDISPVFTFAITKWAPAKEAYEYISYMVSPKSQLAAFTIGGTLPANTAVKLPTNSPNPVKNQVMRYVNGAAEHYIGPDQTIRASVEVQFDKVIPSIFVGQVSLKDALANLQKIQDSLPPLPQK
jgi:ABC-type glycerol-3-phosphate transport system substrate-binding protein